MASIKKINTKNGWYNVSCDECPKSLKKNMNQNCGENKTISFKDPLSYDKQQNSRTNSKQYWPLHSKPSVQPWPIVHCFVSTLK